MMYMCRLVGPVVKAATIGGTRPVKLVAMGVGPVCTCVTSLQNNDRPKYRTQCIMNRVPYLFCSTQKTRNSFPDHKEHPLIHTVQGQCTQTLKITKRHTWRCRSCSQGKSSTTGRDHNRPRPTGDHIRGKKLRNYRITQLTISDHS